MKQKRSVMTNIMRHELNKKNIISIVTEGHIDISLFKSQLSVSYNFCSKFDSIETF